MVRRYMGRGAETAQKKWRYAQATGREKQYHRRKRAKRPKVMKFVTSIGSCCIFFFIGLLIEQHIPGFKRSIFFIAGACHMACYLYLTKK